MIVDIFKLFCKGISWRFGLFHFEIVKQKIIYFWKYVLSHLKELQQLPAMLLL